MENYILFLLNAHHSPLASSFKNYAFNQAMACFFLMIKLINMPPPSYNTMVALPTVKHFPIKSLLIMQ